MAYSTGFQEIILWALLTLYISPSFVAGLLMSFTPITVIRKYPRTSESQYTKHSYQVIASALEICG